MSLVLVVLTASVGGCQSSEQGGGEAVHENSPAPAREVSVPADPIAFVRLRNDRFPAIWLMRRDGGRQVRVSPEGELDEAPAFSPDGKLIAFHRYDSLEADDTDIWMMRPDGSNTTRLTSTPRAGELDPTFSPSGARLAFARHHSGRSRIYTMAADGTDVEALTDGRHDGQPTWAPGGRVAFSRGSDLFAIAVTGRGPTVKLTGDPALDDVYPTSPAFSPNGESIAFLGLRDGTRSRAVWVMRQDGSHPVQVSDGPTGSLTFSNPTWSPNGRRLAFVGLRDGPGIYVVNADGTDQHRLKSGKLNDRDPAWSPGGG